jgi:hypothetical protein
MVHRLGLELAPQLLFGVGRQEVRHHQLSGLAARRHADGGDEVQAQLGQIDQIVARQRLGAQVGVDQAQAAQTATKGALATQIGKQQPLRLADDDVGDDAAAIDEHPDLALDLV